MDSVGENYSHKWQHELKMCPEFSEKHINEALKDLDGVKCWAG